MSEAGGEWMEPNVYGFARHLSCNHPSRAIPYFAVDIAGYRYIFTCEQSERVCVHARLSVRLLYCIIVGCLSRMRRNAASRASETAKYYCNESISLNFVPE